MRAGKSSFSGPDQIRPGASGSHVKRFRQEPRSRRLALTASAGQHFLPALCPILRKGVEYLESCVKMLRLFYIG